jgi:hypothetical protein
MANHDKAIEMFLQAHSIAAAKYVALSFWSFI